MQRKSPLLVVFALTFALAVAGCGSSNESGGSGGSGGSNSGGGSQSPAQTQALTKSELVADADKLCRAMEKKTTALNTPNAEQDLASALGKMLKEYEATLDQLREMTPPADLSATYKTWLEENQKMIEIFEELKKLASEQAEAPAADFSTKVNAQIKRLDELAKQIGFKDCTRQ